MKVPRLIPQQTIQNPNNPYAKAPGPESFGGTIGSALSRSGSQIQEHMEKMQQEKDAIKGLQLTVQAQERVNDLLYGEEGLMTYQGLNADGVSQQFGEKYDEVMGEIMELGENDNQKKIVLQSMMRQLPGYQSQLAKYEATVMQKAKMASLESTLDSQLKIAVNSGGDPETISAVEDQVERTVTAIAGHLGEEAVTQMIDENMSKIHSSVISNLLVDNLPGAKAYYEKYSEELDPASRTKIEEFIHNKEETVENQALSEEIFSRFGTSDEDDAISFIRKNYEGDKEDKLLSRVQGLYVDERRFKQQREQQSYDWMYSSVGKAETYSEALSAIEDSNLKEQHKRTLRNYAKERFNVTEGGKPKTDPETATKLQNMLNKYTLFDEYPTWESFYSEFGDSLSYSDQNKYRGMYEDLRKGQNTTLTYRTQEVLDSKIKEANITDPVVKSEITKRANEYLRAAREKGPLDSVEEAKIIDSLFDEVTLQKREGLFGIDIFARDEKAMRYQLPPDSQWSEQEGRWIPEGYQWNEDLGKSILCIPENGLCYDLDGIPVARFVPDEDETTGEGVQQ